MKLTHDYETSLETQVKENRMIAEFMGYTNNYWYQSDALTYNSSWNMLMPVVEKIDNLNSYSAIHIDNDQVFVHFDKDTEMQDFLNKDYGGKIGAVYAGVVTLIKWFNSQNKV